MPLPCIWTANVGSVHSRRAAGAARGTVRARRLSRLRPPRPAPAPQEDAHLRELVNTWGTKCWTTIAREMRSKCSKQVRARPAGRGACAPRCAAPARPLPCVCQARLRPLARAHARDASCRAPLGPRALRPLHGRGWRAGDLTPFAGRACARAPAR